MKVNNMNETTYADLWNAILRAIPDEQFWIGDLGRTIHIVLDPDDMEIIARDLRIGNEDIEFSSPWQPFADAIGDGVVATTNKVVFNKVSGKWEADLEVVPQEDYYLYVLDEDRCPIGIFDLAKVDSVWTPLGELEDRGIIGAAYDADCRCIKKKNKEVAQHA